MSSLLSLSISNFAALVNSDKSSVSAISLVSTALIDNLFAVPVTSLSSKPMVSLYFVKR